MKVKKSRKKAFYKRPKAWALFALVFVTFSGVLFGVYSLSKSNGDDNSLDLENNSELIIFQKNTLVSVSNPNDPPLRTVGTLQVIITAYSSTPCQTDDTPYITAAGTSVRDGIVANNYLSFGTKIRIPDKLPNPK